MPVDRLGVITMNAEGLEHSRLAAILGHEHGIGVRAGCFCAQPYVRTLLGLTDEEMRSVVARLARGDHATVPGMVRMSLGVYNTEEEVDALTNAVEEVIRDGARGHYVVDEQHGEWVPDHTPYDISSYAPF
jgi:selenocysteine lyase/cysteine desulfurase